MAVTINASTTAGLVQTADTSGVLALQSNGTTALTTSGANVTLAGTLTTAGVITNNLPSSSGNIVALNNTAGERFVIAGDSGGIVLGTTAASTHTSLRVIAADSVVSTFSTTGLAITGLTDISAATSGQIQFPATQNASANANTLDDYEEGTWTPTFSGSAVNGSATYSQQSGTYTKIGNMVTVRFQVTASSTLTGGPTGVLLIRGLPFTVSSATSNQASGGGSITFWNGLATSINTSNLYTDSNNAYLVPVFCNAASATTISYWQVTTPQNTASAAGFATYYVS